MPKRTFARERLLERWKCALSAACARRAQSSINSTTLGVQGDGSSADGRSRDSGFDSTRLPKGRVAAEGCQALDYCFNLYVSPRWATRWLEPFAAAAEPGASVLYFLCAETLWWRCHRRLIAE